MKSSEVPVVLIHGVGLDHSMWESVMSGLARRRTIAYDMIGHGGAAKPAGPYSLQTFVDQLSAVVDALDIEVDLVGFSMGALVAQGYALSGAGEKVRRMVLLNGVHDRTDGERRAILERVDEVRNGGFAATVDPALRRWFTPAFAAANPDMIASVRQRLLDNDPRCFADAYEVFATADAGLKDRVGDITTPTLVATGSNDERSTPAMATALASALANAHSVILPGLRHLTPLEAPDVVAAMIDEFATD
ncbi:MAG: alpha/beta hydrolase [Ilumatobacteraceae bacterium]